jgi:phosphosulfolactate phosphohydrolase-like enzyme
MTMKAIIEAALAESIPRGWDQLVMGANAAERGERAAQNANRSYDHQNAVTALKRKAVTVQALVDVLVNVTQVAAHHMSDERVIAAARKLNAAVDDLYFGVGFVHGVQAPPEE